MLALLIVVLLLAVFAALASRFGADSRDDGDWKPLDLTTPRCTRL